MSDTLGLIFRVVHIFFGVFWVGAALMLAGFIEPAVAALGPEGGRFMQRLVGPGRFGMFMSLAALATVISGLLMFWQGAGGDWSSWLASGYGKAIVAGSVIGFVALVSGLSVNAPTAFRLARIGREVASAGGPPSAGQAAEISRLQKRLHVAGLASALMLTLSVLMMAAARYM